MLLNSSNKNNKDGFEEMRKLRSERRNPPLPRKSIETEMNIYNENYEKRIKMRPLEDDQVDPPNNSKVNSIISNFNSLNNGSIDTTLTSPRDLDKDIERKPSFLIDKYNLIESNQDPSVKSKLKPNLPRISSEKNIKTQIDKPKPPPLPPKKKPQIPPPPNYLPKIYKATIPSPTSKRIEKSPTVEVKEEIFSIVPIKQMGNHQNIKYKLTKKKGSQKNHKKNNFNQNLCQKKKFKKKSCSF